jgi:hypothetical protein
MWDIEGELIDASHFLFNISDEVLIYYDEELFFTFFDKNGGLFLAYWLDLDEEENFTRYLIVPTTKQQIDKLRSGEPILSILQQPICYLLDVCGNTMVKCKKVEFNLIPKDMLPDANVQLVMQ